MTLKLSMVGVIVEDMAKSVEFYRRVGVEIPEGNENLPYVAVKMDELTFFLSTKQFNQHWDPANTDASGGYRIILEFFLKSREAVDAKYNELVGYGYESHVAPYVTSFNTYFAMVNDPDHNTVLLSNEV